MNEETEADVPDDVIIGVTDYLDGALSGAAKSDVETKIANDPVWKRTHDEMIDARKMISGMQKARAPETFVEDVTATIHKRSAGRFFARRTLGDRVPFGVLLIVALLALGAIAFLLRSSPTGSLKPAPKTPEPPKHQPLELRP